MDLLPAQVVLHGGVANPEDDVAVVLQHHVVLEDVHHIHPPWNVDAHGERQLVLHKVLRQVAHGAAQLQRSYRHQRRQGNGLARAELSGGHGDVAHHDVVVDHVDGAVGELEVVVVGVVHVHVGREGRIHGGRAQGLRVVDLHPGEVHVGEGDVRVPELEDGLAEGDDDDGHHQGRDAAPDAALLQHPPLLYALEVLLCQSAFLRVHSLHLVGDAAVGAQLGVRHHVQRLHSHGWITNTVAGLTPLSSVP